MQAGVADREAGMPILCWRGDSRTRRRPISSSAWCFSARSARVDSCVSYAGLHLT